LCDAAVRADRRTVVAFVVGVPARGHALILADVVSRGGPPSVMFWSCLQPALASFRDVTLAGADGYPPAQHVVEDLDPPCEHAHERARAAILCEPDRAPDGCRRDASLRHESPLAVPPEPAHALPRLRGRNLPLRARE